MLIFPSTMPIWPITATDDTPYLPMQKRNKEVSDYIQKRSKDYILLMRERASSTGESALTAMTSDTPRPSWRSYYYIKD